MSKALAKNLPQIANSYGTGWVRSEYYEDLRNLQHLNKDSSNCGFITDSIKKIEDHSVIIKRSNDDISEKQHIANFFWRMAFTSIFIDANIRNIFFEASSSVAYISNRLISHIKENPYYTSKNIREIKIHTNSIITYMQFMFEDFNSPFDLDNIKITPPSFFSKPYGEAFGDVINTAQIPAKAHHSNQFTLRSDADAAVKNVAKVLNERIGSGGGVIFMSVTGIVPGENDFEGIYVRSYRNFLFKRSIASTNIPKIIIFDGSKWRSSFDPQFHYPIFSTNEDWRKFITEQPVCFVWSTKFKNKLDEIKEYFSEYGFLESIDDPLDHNSVSIMYNTSFRESVKIV